MSGHQSARMGTDQWLTPPEIIERLGPFDLDPCSLIERPWPTATVHYTVLEDGLSLPWYGRVWLNPPYGAEGARWLRKLSQHRSGIALIFARTETQMFFDHVWPTATAVLFLKGRLHFHYPDGRRAPHNSGAPSVLIAYSERDAAALASSGIDGRFIRLEQAA